MAFVSGRNTCMNAFHGTTGTSGAFSAGRPEKKDEPGEGYACRPGNDDIYDDKLDDHILKY